jgi:hypothetical protein
MPRYNKTGPRGEGPMTGRGLGRCADSENENSDFFRNGYGCGRGLGRGRGNRLFLGRNDKRISTSDMSLSDEIRLLKEKLSGLESRLAKDDK